MRPDASAFTPRSHTFNVSQNFTKLMTLALSKDAMKNNKFPWQEDHYVTTQSPPDVQKHAIALYALDCEMVLTRAESAPPHSQPQHELARMSIIDVQGNMVRDVFVRPANPIVDYLTKYSGITADHLKDCSTTLKDAQAIFTSLVTSHDFLIGHALDNDLHRLQVIHRRVIDTSVLYPRKLTPPASPAPFSETKARNPGSAYSTPTSTPPQSPALSAASAPARLPPPVTLHQPHFLCKRSLRELARTFLGREIQCASGGHDSIEDAKASLDLVLRFFQHQPVAMHSSNVGLCESPAGGMNSQSARMHGLRPPLIQTVVQQHLHYSTLAASPTPQHGRRYSHDGSPALLPMSGVPLHMTKQRHSSPFPQHPHSRTSARPHVRRSRISGTPQASRSMYKTKPCKYFQMGTCRKGSECTFRHDPPSNGNGSPPRRQLSQTMMAC